MESPSRTPPIPSSAAQANAQRAVDGGRDAPRARRFPPRTADGAAHPVTPAGTAVPVQRAVGFEFEVDQGGSSVNTVKENGKEPKVDSKAALYDLPESGELAYLSSDNGNVEYVTKPLEIRANVETAVSAIQKFHENNSSGETRTISGTESKDRNQYEVWIRKGPPKARPQATIGVGMQDITELFGRLVKMSESKEPLEEPLDGPSKKKAPRIEEPPKTGSPRRSGRLAGVKLEPEQPPHLSAERKGGIRCIRDG